MSIANTAQAEHWNSGEGVARRVSDQARYDRTHEPFTIMPPASGQAGHGLMGPGGLTASSPSRYPEVPSKQRAESDLM